MDRPRRQGAPRSTRTERAVVLAGFALAALWTAVAAASGADPEAVGAAWLAAVLWTVFASLACALRARHRPPRLVGVPPLHACLRPRRADRRRDAERPVRFPGRRRGTRAPDARRLIPGPVPGPASRRGLPPVPLVGGGGLPAPSGASFLAVPNSWPASQPPMKGRFSVACCSNGLLRSAAIPARPSALSSRVTVCRASLAVPFMVISVFVSTRSSIAPACVSPGRGAPAAAARSRTPSDQPAWAAAVSRA